MNERTISGTRRLAAIAVTLVAALLLAPSGSSAQVPTLPPILPTQSPSPSPEPKPPKPDPEPTQGGGGGESNGGSGGSEEGGSSAAREAVDEFLKRAKKSTARTTTRLLALLEELKPGKEPLTLKERARGFGSFPVAGYVWYQRDFAAPRYVPYFHAHEGTDLFADAGTPVIASVDGRIKRLGSFSIGGNAIWLEQEDDTYLYYGHLKKIAKGLKTGQRVRKGQIIGTVGATGNARGTPPHVHFEVHPRGGSAVDPYRVLGRWLSNAEDAAVQQLARRADIDVLSRLGAARWHILVDLMGEPAGFEPALWPSALDPMGAVFGFADFALGTLASDVDWEASAALEIVDSFAIDDEPALGQGAFDAADPLERIGALAQAVSPHALAPFVELSGTLGADGGEMDAGH